MPSPGDLLRPESNYSTKSVRLRTTSTPSSSRPASGHFVPGGSQSGGDHRHVGETLGGGETNRTLLSPFFNNERTMMQSVKNRRQSSSSVPGLEEMKRPPTLLSSASPEPQTISSIPTSTFFLRAGPGGTTEEKDLFKNGVSSTTPGSKPRSKSMSTTDGVAFLTGAQHQLDPHASSATASQKPNSDGQQKHHVTSSTNASRKNSTSSGSSDANLGGKLFETGAAILRRLQNDQTAVALEAQTERLQSALACSEEEAYQLRQEAAASRRAQTTQIAEFAEERERMQAKYQVEIETLRAQTDAANLLHEKDVRQLRLLVADAERRKAEIESNLRTQQARFQSELADVQQKLKSAEQQQATQSQQGSDSGGALKTRCTLNEQGIDVEKRIANAGDVALLREELAVAQAESVRLRCALDEQASAESVEIKAMQSMVGRLEKELTLERERTTRARAELDQHKKARDSLMHVHHVRTEEGVPRISAKQNAEDDQEQDIASSSSSPSTSSRRTTLSKDKEQAASHASETVAGSPWSEERADLIRRLQELRGKSDAAQSLCEAEKAASVRADEVRKLKDAHAVEIQLLRDKIQSLKFDLSSVSEHEAASARRAAAELLVARKEAEQAQKAAEVLRAEVESLKEELARTAESKKESELQATEHLEKIIEEVRETTKVEYASRIHRLEREVQQAHTEATTAKGDATRAHAALSDLAVNEEARAEQTKACLVAKHAEALQEQKRRFQQQATELENQRAEGAARLLEENRETIEQLQTRLDEERKKVDVLVRKQIEDAEIASLCEEELRKQVCSANDDKANAESAAAQATVERTKLKTELKELTEAFKNQAAEHATAKEAHTREVKRLESLLVLYS
ncbi:unnamed protein product [Amoebophrya sp. A25]|nr:unnamed protein product [Amoebophrya sp. A25]|eukprot:GSA25T00006001001.1